MIAAGKTKGPASLVRGLAPLVALCSLTKKNQLFIDFRLQIPIPANPAPNNSNDAGSGTGALLLCISPVALGRVVNGLPRLRPPTSPNVAEKRPGAIYEVPTRLGSIKVLIGLASKSAPVGEDTWFGNPLPSWYLQRLRRHIGKLPKASLDPVPVLAIPSILDRLRTNMAFVVKREPHYPFNHTAQLWRAWDEQSGRWNAAFLWFEQEWPDLAAIALDRLIGVHGHLVKECPAPAIRAKAEEICGRWFVAKRPNQDYCSSTCQSRASTRATRGGTQTAAVRRRVTTTI
jgi:hypothetical protein